jgi:hypothetical protein
LDKFRSASGVQKSGNYNNIYIYPAKGIFKTPDSVHRQESLLPLHKMSISTSPSPIFIEYRDKLAIVTLNKPQKLNSFSKDEFYELATLLREADARPEILVTLLIGAGRYFSA